VEGGEEVAAGELPGLAASPLSPASQSAVMEGGYEVPVAVAACSPSSLPTPCLESAVFGGREQLVAAVGGGEEVAPATVAVAAESLLTSCLESPVVGGAEQLVAAVGTGEELVAALGVGEVAAVVMAGAAALGLAGDIGAIQDAIAMDASMPDGVDHASECAMEVNLVA